MEENKSMFYIVAVVAIVAVCGIVFMTISINMATNTIVSRDLTENGAGLAYTQTIQRTFCNNNTPSFSVSPITQEGEAGSTLIYDLNIKNNDIGCAPRSFLITGQYPLIPPVGMTLQDCYQNPTPCMMDIHFYIYNASRYPDGDRRSNFILDPQENPIVKMTITSNNTWPAGNYSLQVQLNYGIPGEEVWLDYYLARWFTDEIICTSPNCPTQPPCPINCTCEGGIITCPICEFPCIISGETCSCPIEPSRPLPMRQVAR